jgi:integrase
LGQIYFHLLPISVAFVLPLHASAWTVRLLMQAGVDKWEAANAPALALAVLNGLEPVAPTWCPVTIPAEPRHDLKRPWDAVTKRAGLISIRLHDLRHTYASFGALNKGTPSHRLIENVGAVVSTPVLGELHHRYCRI